MAISLIRKRAFLLFSLIKGFGHDFEPNCITHYKLPLWVIQHLERAWRFHLDRARQLSANWRRHKYLRKSTLTFCPLALWERVGVRVKKLAKYFCVGTYVRVLLIRHASPTAAHFRIEFRPGQKLSPTLQIVST